MFAKSLSKTMTATVLCMSLALTSLTPHTASAQISDDEALAGIITLLLLGAAIHNSRDRSPEVVTRPSQDWRILPSRCLRRVETRRGDTVRMFGQRCLNNNYAYVNRLPEACHIRVRNQEGQRRQGFRPRCLRNAGFRTDRH